MTITGCRPTAYDELFAYAHAAAAALVESRHRPRSSRALRMYASAAAILRYPSPTSVLAAPRTAAHDALDAVVMDWPRLASGEIDGDDIMRSRPGLWPRLMTEWPMMEYADTLIATLSDQPPRAGRILEVGCGVGNTTKRLSAIYGDRLTWSDREPLFIRKGRWPGVGQVFDFDADPPAGLGQFTTIVATNALHCAARLGRTLGRLHHMLVPGGLLMIAEGSSPTRDDGQPWALDVLFCAFDGWWDRGGFRTRDEWVAALTSHGFTGISQTRIGPDADDLGGVIWATRAAA